jgi:hypothetical protein
MRSGGPEGKIWAGFKDFDSPPLKLRKCSEQLTGPKKTALEPRA